MRSFRSIVCRTAGFSPGSGLETCPSVAAVARSGNVATTRSVIAKTPGDYSRSVPNANPGLPLVEKWTDEGSVRMLSCR